jgi:hypothetical protein
MYGVTCGGDARLRQKHLIKVDAEIANGVALGCGFPEVLDVIFDAVIGS